MKKTNKILIKITIAALLLLAVSCFASCAKPEVRDDYPHHCTLYIDCKSILDNMDMLDPEKAELVPADGVLLEVTEVGFDEGDSVYDILLRELRSRGMHIDSSFVPAYGTAYVKGICNLYEFDCGYSSGWEYCVNGVFPNYGCSAYEPKEGDAVRFLYTCNLGEDIGNAYTGD